MRGAVNGAWDRCFDLPLSLFDPRAGGVGARSFSLPGGDSCVWDVDAPGVYCLEELSLLLSTRSAGFRRIGPSLTFFHLYSLRGRASPGSSTRRHAPMINKTKNTASDIAVSHRFPTLSGNCESMRHCWWAHEQDTFSSGCLRYQAARCRLHHLQQYCRRPLEDPVSVMLSSSCVATAAEIASDLNLSTSVACSSATCHVSSTSLCSALMFARALSRSRVRRA
jgi:hypothetical protein